MGSPFLSPFSCAPCNELFTSTGRLYGCTSTWPFNTNLMAGGGGPGGGGRGAGRDPLSPTIADTPTSLPFNGGNRRASETPVGNALTSIWAGSLVLVAAATSAPGRAICRPTPSSRATLQRYVPHKWGHFHVPLPPIIKVAMDLILVNSNLVDMTNFQPLCRLCS